MVDVVDVILADHQRIRRTREALEEADRAASSAASSQVLALIWDRLAFLIEMNADAEEEICHLAVYGTGPLALEQVQDASADLDDIRAAVAEARLQPAGSPGWRRAVAAALSANRRHLARRERGPLHNFARRAPRSDRQKLAGQLAAFTSARIAELVPPAKQDGTVCHYCQWPLTTRHRHVLDDQRLGIFCSCDVCHALRRQIETNPGMSDRQPLNGLRPAARPVGPRRRPAGASRLR